MSLIIRHDIDEDIRQHNFEHLAYIFRQGKAGELTLTTQTLIAEYFEGKLKRSKGRPKNQEEHLLAESLYSDFWHLRQYGRTTSEFCEYVTENYSVYGKGLSDVLKSDGMTRMAAIEKLSEINIMGCKNVERLVDLGKKINDHQSDLLSELRSEP